MMGQHSSQPPLDITVCGLVRLPARRMFVCPALATSNIIQVRLVKTNATIMLAHTTLVTIFPRKATSLILRQQFTSLSFQERQTATIGLSTHRTMQSELSKHAFSRLFISSCSFHTTQSLDLNTCCGIQATIRTSPTTSSMFSKRMGQNLQSTVTIPSYRTNHPVTHTFRSHRRSEDCFVFWR